MTPRSHLHFLAHAISDPRTARLTERQYRELRRAWKVCLRGLWEEEGRISFVVVEGGTE